MSAIRTLTLIGLFLLPGAASAVEQPPIPATPRLEAHSNYFAREVYDLQTRDGCREKLAPLSYRAYSAVGFNLANTIVLVGPDGGLVIVDTLGSADSAMEALEAVRTKARLQPSEGKLPIKAIIYTHNHIDHTAGVGGMLAMADRPACPPEDPRDAGQDGTLIARQDCVEVISQKQVVDSVINTATVVGEMINPRSSYMYGAWIGANKINDGIGLGLKEGDSGFRMPSRTFTDELLLSAAGISMKLIYVPSETDDELSVFIPDGINQSYRGGAGSSAAQTVSGDGWGGPGMLLSAEVIQGPSYPNLYSLRGTSYRNPAQWFRSVDKLRAFDSWSMVPAHGVPLCDEESIRILLRNFRDAIQFTHDQAVRRINQGYTIEELAADIHMPDYLVNDLRRMTRPIPDVLTEDYLTPFYGSVPQSVREIYYGYLGWFQADPVALQPTPPRALSVKTVEMMGGSNRVVKTASAALGAGLKLQAAGKAKEAHEKLQWAAELTTEVIRAEGRVGGQDSGPTVSICGELAKERFNALSPWYQCRLVDAKRKLPPPNCTGTASYCRAREVKARAFVSLAEVEINPNWRNWYISSAQELCGLMEGAPPAVGGLISTSIVEALPPAAWVNSWTMRLKAEKTAPSGQDATCGEGSGVHDSLGFLFLGDDEVAQPSQTFALHVRCAIAELETIEQPVTSAELKALSHVRLAVSLTYRAWSDLLDATANAVACQEEQPFSTALKRALATGGVKVLKGSPEQVTRFFDHFDEPQTTFQALTLR